MALFPSPTHLSHAEKDTLITALTAQLAAADERIAAQDSRIAALEARLDELTRPPKTPDNSSKPPSQGQKHDVAAAGTDRPPRKSRPGVGRTLHPHPDRTIDRRLATCPNCEAVFPDASQTPQQIYERIELPPVRPDVTQVRLFGGRCACCGERVIARPPAELEQGSPFGHSIAAMVVYSRRHWEGYEKTMHTDATRYGAGDLSRRTGYPQGRIAHLHRVRDRALPRRVRQNAWDRSHHARHYQILRPNFTGFSTQVIDMTLNPNGVLSTPLPIRPAAS